MYLCINITYGTGGGRGGSGGGDRGGLGGSGPLDKGESGTNGGLRVEGGDLVR